MLLTGGLYDHNQVVQRRHDADGNVIGWSHSNLVLYTHQYEVQFAGGKVTTLTMNAIAELKYMQYDKDGNEFLLLGPLTDHCKNEKAFTCQTEGCG